MYLRKKRCKIDKTIKLIYLFKKAKGRKFNFKVNNKTGAL